MGANGRWGTKICQLNRDGLLVIIFKNCTLLADQGPRIGNPGRTTY
jgi:hypothetical protein